MFEGPTDLERIIEEYDETTFVSELREERLRHEFEERRESQYYGNTERELSTEVIDMVPRRSDLQIFHVDQQQSPAAELPRESTAWEPTQAACYYHDPELAEVERAIENIWDEPAKKDIANAPKYGEVRAPDITIYMEIHDMHPEREEKEEVSEITWDP